MTSEDNENSVYSNFTEEDELFEYIHNLEVENIKKMLSKKTLSIWEFKNKENHNSSVLNIAAYKKSLKITEILIDYCKKNNLEKLKEFVNAANDQGVAPLHYASFRGEVPIIKLLIENGAEINIITKRKLNVIHYSAQGNKPNVLMYFYLQLKNSKNETDKYKLITDKDTGGSTPLHWAVYSVAEDLLLYLINLPIFDSEEKKMAFINQLDNDGNSALHLSVSSKSSRIAMKLLQNGAKSNLVNNKGETALQLAIHKKQFDIMKIIENNQSCQFCNFKAPVKQIKKSPNNIICVFSFQIISILIIFGSILPIFFNKNNGLIGNLLFYIYFVLLVFFFIIYIFLLIKDPGLQKQNNLDYLENLINENIDLHKYCYKCFTKKTKTSKHCIICDRCYEKFDHHCYWINKCVAKNNFSLFLFFLIETAFYLIIALIINILSLINISDVNDQNFEIDNYTKKSWNFFSDACKKIFKIQSKFIIHLILNILLILLILSFLIPEFLLLILHIKVFCSNYKEEKNRKTTTSSFSTTSLIGEDDNSLLLSNNSSKV